MLIQHTLSEFKSITKDTLDESPFAYGGIIDTVEIDNFKAGKGVSEYE